MLDCDEFPHSPSNLTARKTRLDVFSSAWVQAPVEADMYQGVATQ